MLLGKEFNPFDCRKSVTSKHAEKNSIQSKDVLITRSTDYARGLVSDSKSEITPSSVENAQLKTMTKTAVLPQTSQAAASPYQLLKSGTSQSTSSISAADIQV